MVPKNHICFLVDEVIELIDSSEIERRFQSGTSCLPPEDHVKAAHHGCDRWNKIFVSFFTGNLVEV